MNTNIFIDENEDIFEAFEKAGLEYDTQKVQHLRFISNKQSNNYIGYYQFKSQGTYYKFYILPKTTPKTDDANQNKKNFINLLKTYYELKVKYKEIKAEEILDNVIDFSFDDKRERQNSDDVADFINYKYQDALNVIESFFKKHNHSILKEISFISQSIKDRLDLGKNIVELDKSKVHQTKKRAFIYSKYAVITMECLDYFLKKSLTKSTKSKVNKINSKLNNRYKIKDKFSFKVKQITSKKITKYFKTNEQQQLYSALLQLVGVENYFENNISKNIIKLHNQHSLFFRPEKLYEWIVYDKLLQMYPQYEIYKDSFGNGTCKQYSLAGIQRDSQPDFILQKDDEIIVADAKWKVLESKSSISFEDVAKLRRDTLLNNGTKSFLIYPDMSFDSGEFQMSFNDKEKFNFTLLLISPS
jgi:hypothetical protein